MADGPLAVVLAAGRGTRMRSAVPKALHPLGGRPLVVHAVDAATAATGAPPVVVIAPGEPEVRRLLEPLATLVEQAQPRGTGDALRSLPQGLRSSGPVLVTNADTPLLRPETLRALLAAQGGSGRRATLLAVTPADPRGMGRVVRDGSGDAIRIVEERDLPAGEPAPTECNAGVYAFDGAALWPALDRLRPDNAQGELYLTDVVEMLGPCGVLEVDEDEVVGINDRRHLAHAEAVLRRRTLDSLMLAGVTVEDPATTYVDAGVEVGRDTVLRPMTTLRGSTRLGEGCAVGPMAQLCDVVAGDRVGIGASALDQCVLEDDVTIGHYVRVRPGSRLRRGVYLGTHAEVKNSDVGPDTHVGHFACVLDADVGARVNFSAGAVTCNYDGRTKSRVVIGDDVFVGSDVMLVAPLTVGVGAYLGAGSVITKNVPAGALALERSPQRTVPGWAERRRAAIADASP